MKYLFCILFCFLSCAWKAPAQLADGAIAPDFTFTDINGNSQNLYSYLDQGKYVVLDISATWCVPCWDYHNSGTLDSIYQLHDQPAGGDWKIILIEADAGTDSADLHGSGTNTQGDWVQGAAYTIIDPPQGAELSSFRNGYAISYYPTFYMICPDRRVYQDTFLKILSPHVSTWEYAASNLCSATGVAHVTTTGGLSVYPNPASAIVNFDFSAAVSGTAVLKIMNMLGQEVDEKEYNLPSAGKASFQYDATHLRRGLYYFTLSNGRDRLVRKILLQ